MMVQAPGGGVGGVVGGRNGGQAQAMNTIDIRQDEDGNILGGERVLRPVEGRRSTSQPQIVPLLPKVQRNSASRLPFLLEILPRVMNITKETTPVEIRECLLREYSAEVHLQQCRRAKTEILKKLSNGEDEMRQQQQTTKVPNQPQAHVPDMRAVPQQQQQPSLDGMSEVNNASQQLFGDMNSNMNSTPTQNPHPFTLHSAPTVVTPVMSNRSAAALQNVTEAPVRCPYCINHRWMKSIKDAVEHMSMHVVV